MRTHHPRFVGRVLLASAFAIGIAACGGGGSPSVANVAKRGESGVQGGASGASRSNPAQSLLEWATCIRSHGDPDQSDPTIDAHGVINIYIPASANSLSNAVHGGTAPCNSYLAAASAELRAATPTAKPPDQAQLVKYSQCMRANGVPNYPDPGTGSETNFRGTGIDPNSPFVVRANDLCGKQIGAPAWWISGTGPPGDISVQSGPVCGGSPCPPRGGSGAILPPRNATKPATGG